MLRLAVIMLFVATFIGAMMPAGRRADSADGNSVNLVEGTSSSSSTTTGWGGTGSTTTSAEEVTLSRAFDGHFYAEARVNGVPVHFLVDTGATGVVLSESDAERAGIGFSSDTYDVVGRGASGSIRGQPVAIREVALGPHVARDMDGVVIEDAEISLLGQSFLSQIDDVSIHGDKMVLR